MFDWRAMRAAVGPQPNTVVVRINDTRVVALSAEELGRAREAAAKTPAPPETEEAMRLRGWFIDGIFPGSMP